MAVTEPYEARWDDREEPDESTGEIGDDEDDAESLTEGLIRLPKLTDPSIWSVCTLVSLYHSVTQCLLCLAGLPATLAATQAVSVVGVSALGFHPMAHHRIYEYGGCTTPMPQRVFYSPPS